MTRVDITEAANRALEAFLRRTAGLSARMRALRALTLHMLEGHAKKFFIQAELAPILAEAVAALRDIPVQPSVDLNPEEMMARIDAAYVLAERGQSFSLPDRDALYQYLRAIFENGHILHAWLIGELARALGLNIKISLPDQLLKEQARVHYLYWVTHLYLLETRYLHKPLPKLGWMAKRTELLASADWLIGRKQIDLAAEVIFCLQLAGEEQSREYEKLLALILAEQQSDGSVLDNTSEDGEDSIAHTTAAALIAFGGAISLDQPDK